MTDDLAVVRKLLADLTIESLIIIDDEWETTSRPPVEDVIGEVRGALLGEDSPERQRISATLAELNLAESGPWDEQLRRRWADGGEAVQERLATQLPGRGSDSPGPLAAALLTIASWFGEDGPRLVQLTPRQWDTDGKRLLDDVKGSAICLFDEDLRAGRRGTRLMEAAVSEKRPEGRLFFGLLTATISQSGEETGTESLQHQVSSDRVIVIAKDRITTGAAQFADGLRSVVLATYHDSLRAMAKAAITNAHKETTRRLDSLTVTDFDRIVLETAHREGTWEGDELLRLIGIWERSERRTNIFAERDQIEQLLRRIRAVRPSTDHMEPASSRVRELRRLELYAADDINRAYLPIELGDVFSLKGKEWVLLAQACEMMVRNDGRRARNPRFAPLAAITQAGVPSGPSDASYRLEYYVASTGNAAYVDFREVAFLPLSVLDLVSFRLDGQASIDPASEAPAGAFASLRQRYEVIAKEFKTVLKDLEVAKIPPVGNLPKDEQLRLKRLALAPYRGEAGLKLVPTQTSTELSFGLHRSGRILPPHATAMLTRFHQWRSRPAFEADFAS